MSEAQRKEIRALLRRVSKEYDAIMQGVADGVLVRMGQGQSVEAAVSAAFEAQGAEQRLEKLYLDTGSATLVISGYSESYAYSVEARKTLLRSSYNKRKIPLLTTLRADSLQPVVVHEIRQQMVTNANTIKTWRDLVNTNAFEGDLPKKLRELIGKARNAGYPVADLRQEAQAFQRYVAGLTDRPEYKSVIKAAYNRVLAAVQSGSREALEKVAQRAVEQKAKYNALRVARTESAYAYGQSTMDLGWADPDIGGYRFLLDPSHDFVDECDFYANADLYGFGPGIYPKSEAPVLPIHPNGLSTLNSVSISKATPGAKMRPGVAAKVKAHPASKRIDLGKTIQPYKPVFPGGKDGSGSNQGSP